MLKHRPIYRNILLQSSYLQFQGLLCDTDSTATSQCPRYLPIIELKYSKNFFRYSRKHENDIASKIKQVNFSHFTHIRTIPKGPRRHITTSSQPGTLVRASQTHCPQSLSPQPHLPILKRIFAHMHAAYLPDNLSLRSFYPAACCFYFAISPLISIV